VNGVVEFLLLLIGILLALTIGSSIEYYKQIRKIQREYKKAKGAVEDIVLSFNRELKREAHRLEVIAYKVEGSNFKADTSLRKADDTENRIILLERELKTMSNNNTDVLSKISDMDTKNQNIEAEQKTLNKRIIEMEDKMQKVSEAPEIKCEPVIPMIKDKAMAALTDTEVAVLEMLSTEGSKTAPEIRERVQLSREHTARLMKKLYEKGYLERETGKIPFRYNVKKEMKKFLNKAETEQV
jgi:predicted transcriptional regulator